MRKAILSLFILLGFLTVETQAQQVAKRIVVEHYTNTRCSICASRNPGFLANLENHPDVYHISIHPSSPYSNCVLHQHNTVENDARTQDYGIYGGTPRLVIQGTPISAGTNYGNASIFDEYENSLTPISLNVIQTKVNGILTINLEITAEADNTIGSANLFIAAVEQLINYDAPNGEQEHHNVFRKTLNEAPTGELVTVPGTAGETMTLQYSIMDDSDWDFDQIYAMAILQNSTTKSVIQVDASDPTDNIMVATEEINTLAATIFPNPVKDQLQIRLPEMESAELSLFNTQGAVLKTQPFDGETTLDMNELPSGIYWIYIKAKSGVAMQKVVKG